MSNRSPDNFMKHGRYAGWKQYRYGEIAKPVSVAKVKLIFNHTKRETIVGRVADILRGGRPSLFEREGTSRAGLRSALCLDGFDWHRSDAEAVHVVARALALLGAERPSSDEARADATSIGDRCSWCGINLPEDMLGGGRKSRFCCPDHARAAVAHNSFEQKTERDRAYAAAQRVLRKDRNEARMCTVCGSAFKPIREASRQQFCSQACRGRARRSVPERECPTCKKMFRGAMGQIYCRKRCYDEAGRDIEYKVSCLWCGAAFVAFSGNAGYCCDAHQNRWHRLGAKIREGKHLVLTPPAFDYVARRVGARVTDDYREAA